ncbi:MAG: AAA family ATPase [Deltaproteobacteria bacterium]|nr:AAA family ATPase [Deltaproteobacteria bacterium]
MNTGHLRNSQRDTVFAAGVYRADEEPSNPTSELDALRIELRNEVRAIRSMLTRLANGEDLARELREMKETLGDLALAPGGTKRGDRVSTLLRSRGIEGPAAAKIVAIAKNGEGVLEDRVMAAIAEVAPTVPWHETTEGRRIVALVGPAGVGKTTTIAKLAARARVAGKSVTLIACDAYRVGAVDQLERYADLLGARFEVARTVAELVTLLEEDSSDQVFVDTAGRAPMATAPEAALVARRKKEAPVPVEVLLCMAAATRAADATKIASTFAPLAPTGVCVTKVDETVAASGLIHAPFAARKALALICNGPRVPEDILSATPEFILDTLRIAEGLK